MKPKFTLNMPISLVAERLYSFIGIYRVDWKKLVREEAENYAMGYAVVNHGFTSPKATILNPDGVCEDVDYPMYKVEVVEDAVPVLRG